MKATSSSSFFAPTLVSIIVFSQLTTSIEVTRSETRRILTTEDEKAEFTDKELEQYNKESTELLQTLILGGKPGVDYPNFVRPPRTTFKCRNMDHDGMFADLEADCQVYHTCMSRRQYTFMCPTGTLFNQALMTCDYWFNVNCNDSKRFYGVNIDVFNSFQPAPRSTTARPPAPPRPRTTPLPRSSRTPTFAVANTLSATSSTTPRPPIATAPPRRPSPVYVPPRPRTTSTTTRPLFDDDGPDWVYAWLKENKTALVASSTANSVSDTNKKRQMSVQDFPLFADPKTETAFDFLMDSENDKRARSSFDFKINHQRQNDKFSRAFEDSQPQFVARAHNELMSETGNHPSPWKFPTTTSKPIAAAVSQTLPPQQPPLAPKQS